MKGIVFRTSFLKLQRDKFCSDKVCPEVLKVYYFDDMAMKNYCHKEASA